MKDTVFTINEDNLTMESVRTFDAPPELVWRALTEPELVSQWWGPKNYVVEVEQLDLQVGGTWRIVNRDTEGNVHAFYGEYLAIDAPRVLTATFNYEPIGPGHEIVETYRLTPDGGVTHLTNFSTFKSLEDLRGMVETGMEEGARESYERLEALLAELVG